MVAHVALSELTTTARACTVPCGAGVGVLIGVLVGEFPGPGVFVGPEVGVRLQPTIAAQEPPAHGPHSGTTWSPVPSVHILVPKNCRHAVHPLTPQPPAPVVSMSVQPLLAVVHEVE